MSEFDDVFGEDNEEESETFEPDPATIAYLDQQSAEFQAIRDDFAAVYGFSHDCVCAQDYAEGNVESVTKCFLNMVDDALETCARLNWENMMLNGMLGQAMAVNTKFQNLVTDEQAASIMQESIQEAFSEAEMDEEMELAFEMDEEGEGEPA